MANAALHDLNTFNNHIKMSMKYNIMQKSDVEISYLLFTPEICGSHDDVIKWKHFPRYWPFVRGIHRSPVNSPHKGQWRGALIFSLICVWINGWVNNRETGDLRRYRAHYDVIVMNFKRVISEHRFVNTSCELALRWMPQNTFDDKSTLF